MNKPRLILKSYTNILCLKGKRVSKNFKKLLHFSNKKNMIWITYEYMLICYKEKVKMENEEFICQEKCPHFNLIHEVKISNIDREELLNLSEMFKLFADETRLRIICSILKRELCVCDLCELLNLNQSTVSHQLQLLRNSKLVKYRREGKQVYYSLEDEHIENIIKMALAHITEGDERK